MRSEASSCAPRPRELPAAERPPPLAGLPTVLMARAAAEVLAAGIVVAQTRLKYTRTSLGCWIHTATRPTTPRATHEQRTRRSLERITAGGGSPLL